MLASHRFPLHFDPARLAADLAQVRPEEWQPHFNARDYEGEWSGVALRAAGGDAARLYSAPNGALDAVIDTPVLARCPYFREVLAQFACPVRSARLLRLHAGSIIREHRDDQLGLEHGEVRIHVPIATNPDVAFFVNGRRLPMGLGEAWYVNVSLPHRVNNPGASHRVHLVIDCIANDWLRALMPPPSEDTEANATADVPRSPENLSRFRERVGQSDALEEELRDIVDRSLFIERVVELGRAAGLPFHPEDVIEELQIRQAEWYHGRSQR